MAACVLAFVGIYAAVLGIGVLSLDIWWEIPLFGMVSPFWAICLLGGFLVSLCVLGYIRMMGELSGEEDPDVIYHTTRITAFLGLLATVAVCTIQSYFRMTYDINNFLLHKGAWLQDVLALEEPTLEGNLAVLVLALPVLIGIPFFVFAFFAQSFDEYVTVHYMQIAGGKVETGRSEAYLPIWPTLIIGLLLSAALIFLALTPLVYLLIVPFAILLFGYPHKKKIIASSVVSGIIAVVAVILAFTLSIGGTQQSSDATPTAGLVYSDTGSGYSVSGYEGKDTAIVIPKKHEGKPVVAIGEGAFADSEITSVTIPDSVKAIGKQAFQNCTVLTAVSLPSGITEIAEGTFSGCSALTDITIPNTIQTIASEAFSGCTALAEIILPPSFQTVSGRAFYKCPILIIRVQATPQGREGSFGDGCPVVWNCLQNEVAEDGYIHTYVDGLHYMLKDGEATMATRHTQAAQDIKSLTIPASIGYKSRSYPVTAIAERAFYEHTALCDVTIPASVEVIGKDAFSGCSPYVFFCEAESQSIGFESNWNVNCPVVWNCKSNATATDGFAYKKVDNLYYAASYDTARLLTPRKDITEANIAASIEIGESVYYVTGIGNECFMDCKALTSVTIPNSVIAIGDSAFSGCTDLTEITIPASVRFISKAAFSGCYALTIRCEAESRPSGWHENWKSTSCPVVFDAANNDIADDGYIYTMQDGIRYALKDGQAAVAVQRKSITTAKIPATVIYKGTSYPVTSIGERAFWLCYALTDVTLPASITSIGDYSFVCCKALKSINLPARLESIGDYAFGDCSGLEAVSIPSAVTTIGEYAFSGCTSLTSIIIPEGVTTIGENAFWYNFPTINIYCEAKSQPSGWHKRWNSSDCPVVWGYTGK